MEGGNIAVMEFESATSAALPKVEPGAHIDVHLPNGMVPIFALPKSNDEGKFRLGILRDPESHGGSISAFDEIKDGMQIQVSEPKFISTFKSQTQCLDWRWNRDYAVNHGISTCTMKAHHLSFTTVVLALKNVLLLMKLKW